MAREKKTGAERRDMPKKMGKPAGREKAQKKQTAGYGLPVLFSSTEEKKGGKGVVPNPGAQVDGGASVGKSAVPPAEKKMQAGAGAAGTRAGREDADRMSATEIQLQREVAARVKEGKVMLGSRSVVRGMKHGRLGAVYAAANCPAGLREQLQLYAERSGVAVHLMQADAAMLGEICGKPFMAVVVGVRK